MRGRASLQRRLSIGLAFGVTAMWLLATLGSGLIVRHELDETFDSALQETAQRLLPLAVLEIMEREEEGAEQTVGPVGEHEEFLTYLVRDASGRVLLRSHDAEAGIFPATAFRGFRDSATHRLYGETAISGTVFIAVAEPLGHRREATFEAIAALFIPLLLLVPASLVAVWWFVRLSMKPVLSFRDEIESRDGSDLSPVAAQPLPAELGPVADAVNRLLERLRRTLEAERSFTANSAHELRTPIAATLARTQRLIAEAPDDAVRQRARQIESSLQQLTRLAEKLMQLAKAEGGGLRAERPQDLGDILAFVIEEFRRGPDGARLQLATLPSGALISPMDPDAFAILLRNLIENALKHGLADEPVEVTVVGARQLSVVNASPALSPVMLERLKGRFERGTTDAQGSGLGLAIADAIASGAGGALELYSPARGRDDGFEAVVRLPV